MAMSKIWLVTGSSRGLGRALTEAVLAAGDRVVGTARKPEQLDDLVTKYGDQLRAVALDVTDADAARAAVRTAVEAFGGLDVVANNAGYANSASIEEMADGDFRAQVETNSSVWST
jgi:NAD(P)-dependent dehydrogenase (short-subunit alcohol dehydrogenase family)